MAESIREFRCKECGRMTVTDPMLPDDYIPNICKRCWALGELRRRAKAADLLAKVQAVTDAAQACIASLGERP